MKLAIMGVGCTIAVLAASTAAVAQPFYRVEGYLHQPSYRDPSPVTPSIISYPPISYPSSSNPASPWGYVPSGPHSPWGYVPSTPTMGWPSSSNQTITFPSIEISPRRYSTYRYRNYPYSRSKTIYINPGHSQSGAIYINPGRAQIRKTIIYTYPTYPYNPYTPFGH